MKNAELKDKIPSGKSGTYKGGNVYISNPGIYFDIDVYDYTSEYPGVADAENLSYETINCPHPECESNIVPDHGFHICRKEKGIVSALLGAIRDLRIYFKNTLKKNGTIFDRVVVGALKICVLSSYGMFGMSGHEVEMPAIASSITFFGRKNLSLGQITAFELGYKCLYGDTDSIFINHLNDKERERLIEELKRRTKIEIDFDKRYKYVIISRKKNYLGCGYDGRIDIKGMSGKKRHQCLFLKNIFNEILNVLRGINKIEDLNIAKNSIEKIIHDKLEKLKLREVRLEDLSFRVRLSKDISAKGQPYDVARLYLANGIKKQNGDFVEYVLTKGVYSAKPTFIARISEIDVDGYIQRLEGMLKQIFEPLDMNVNEVLYGKNMSLESFSDDNAKLPNFESKFREGIEKWFEE
jgi:DNA polymerase I